jgi:hypothetical protein
VSTHKEVAGLAHAAATGRVPSWMARPQPFDWLAACLFWLVCLDLGAVAAVAVRVLS